MRKPIIILYGPTGVGKSDYAIALASDFPLEIVNCDVGQLYTPLSIGTAKPDWKQEKTPHHLFDLLDKPRDYTVVEYKKKMLELCDTLWQKGKVPLLVGGSGFYIKSLFFPPQDDKANITTASTVSLYSNQTTPYLYEELIKRDPRRAAQLHPHDRYRIERALIISDNNPEGNTPVQPHYQDLGCDVLLMCLTRPRKELYDRINQRTEKMMEAGWIEEVAALQNSAWESFLKRKKLIGYPEIFSYLEEHFSQEDLVQLIAQKTRHYAKRQMTFWRMLEKQLAPYKSSGCSTQLVSITDEAQTYRTCKNIITTFLSSL